MRKVRFVLVVIAVVALAAAVGPPGSAFVAGNPYIATNLNITIMDHQAFGFAITNPSTDISIKTGFALWHPVPWVASSPETAGVRLENNNFVQVIVSASWIPGAATTTRWNASMSDTPLGIIIGLGGGDDGQAAGANRVA
ncbi:MAG: hypothetical protein A2666_05675 [Parcubacteria group bacterium RIFCSPHIGHO2_01_FULL_47_10b]|nr:MAG: hypothetical protein A2666_05675 [Parcubacteria group bacterium RIFCSPHIGHO2_01_FULL_47_10b]